MSFAELIIKLISLDKFMEQVSVKKAIESLKDFINTYDKQHDFESYSTNTLVHDVLYGLGIAIDKEKYHAAQGYDKFKEALSNLILKKDWIDISKQLPTETCDTNPLILFCPGHGADKVLTGNYKQGEFTAFFECADYHMEYKEVFPSHWIEAPNEINVPLCFVNKGNSEENLKADSENLNCPSCNGSGHVDDVSKHNVEQQIIGIEMAVEKFGVNWRDEISLHDPFELIPDELYNFCDEIYGGDSQHVSRKAK